MDDDTDDAPPTPESPADRLARAAALQAGLQARFAGKARDAKPAVATLRGLEPPDDTPLCGDLEPEVRAVLAGLDLHRRRYGLTHSARTALRRIGKRTLAEAAATPYRRLSNEVGYREADAARERLRAIVEDVRSGVPEPGVTRMAAVPDHVADWLAERPVEDVAGRGIGRPVAAALREAGHGTLLGLAREEADAIEDIHRIGAATVAALRTRLAGIVEAASASRARHRRGADDAEWDAAAPGGD